MSLSSGIAFDFLDIPLDQGGILVDVVRGTVRNEKGRSLGDAISLSGFFISRRVNVLVVDDALIEKHLRHLAVRAGRRGEEQELSHFRGLSLFWMAAGASGLRADVIRIFILVDQIGLTIVEFLRLAFVPVLDWAIVTGDTAIDFRLFAADRALPNFAREVTVFRANAVSRRHGVIRQLVVFGNLADELHAAFPVRESLP